jgi:hypothetical protein
MMSERDMHNPLHKKVNLINHQESKINDRNRTGTSELDNK